MDRVRKPSNSEEMFRVELACHGLLNMARFFLKAAEYFLNLGIKIGLLNNLKT
jgi:hypothetical protein